ncbi:MAG: GatB/YqeY domain-containing protein [Gemmatimonadota bacterium]|nr:MAG: GatB/YqeY domain-containing protein [Gemmatimonadota bacterium]
MIVCGPPAGGAARITDNEGLEMTEASLKERLRSDMNDARRKGAKDRARLFSTLLADVKNREIELGHELDDQEVVEVLARCVKLRKEAAEQMASRPELAEKERAEAAAIKEYLPPEADEEEIRQKVREAIEAGANNIGAVMGKVMPQFKGRAEGREVNRVAREELEKGGSGD